jgi:hypothetical protein
MTRRRRRNRRKLERRRGMAGKPSAEVVAMLQTERSNAVRYGSLMDGVVFGPLGPDRFTVERFLSNCEPSSVEALRAAWSSGFQLAARRVPRDALPAVVILAAYAYANEIALVDDYEVLLDRFSESLDGSIHHPDLFFASACRIIFDKIGGAPSSTAFESIGVPGIYNELMGEE